MNNKHTNKKVEFQVIVDNKTCVAFNTEKKRKDFIAKLNGKRKVTSVSNIQYPWNPEDGIHNLVSPSDFAKHCGIEKVNRVIRAIKNGKIQTEMLGDKAFIVEKYGHFRINGSYYFLEKTQQQENNYTQVNDEEEDEELER